MKKELLAPAGDIEAGYAALYYGADAVYLGLKQFSARATASNFTEDELCEFTAFAHYLNKKVFVTINTVLQDHELDDLMKNLDICCKAGIDAVILQDLGVANIIKKYYPTIEMHASTQMAVHNKQGAIALKRMGFSRVVLARELTLAEIKEIATIDGLELETFVHGALCYSYSGICQFSSFANGRSANRGKCLYPCRSEFLRDGKFEHCFSMKDFALEEDILKLPVYSLKIEGRKKNALYVAAVVDYYRNILDGNGKIREKAQNIKQIFSRPWCKFHFKGKNKEVTDKKFVGHRGLVIGKVESFDNRKVVFTTDFRIARHDGIQIDVEGMEKPYGFSLQNFRVNGKNVWEAKSGDKVDVMLPTKINGLKKGDLIYLASSSEVKGTYGYSKPKPKEFMPRIDIDVDIIVTKDKIEAKVLNWSVESQGCFDKANNIDRVGQTIKDVFAKTGNTNFSLKTIQAYNPENLFVPVSVLNDLRRRLYEKIVYEYISTRRDIVPVRTIFNNSKWIVKIDDAKKARFLDFGVLEEIIYLIKPDTDMADVAQLPRNKVRIALPAVCRNTEDFKPIITKLINAGYKKWEISNYWGLEVLPVKKIDLSFDNLIYMFNSEAVDMAQKYGVNRVTLPVEDTFSNIKNMAMISSLPVAMVVYQDVPLFTSAVCIRDNLCKDCNREKQWIRLERDEKKYDALSENCQLMLFDKRAYCVASEAKSVKADFYRADFVYKNYTAEDVVAILAKLMNFEDVKQTQKGNISRRNENF